MDGWPPMSIVCLSHVMRYSEAKLGARLVLFVLAEHAHDDGSNAFPTVATMAERSRLTRKAVQTSLRRLEADGMIAAEGFGPNGQVSYRVSMGGVVSTPRVADDQGGRSSRPGGGVAATPEPKANPSSTRPTADCASDDRRAKVPEDFPAELRPAAREVLRVLRAVAEDHPGAKAVWPREVALAMTATPRRAHVATAHALAGWAVDPPRAIKDVVATYRTFLRRERDLASPERIAEDGSVVESSARAGVTQLHGRRSGGRGEDALRGLGIFEGGVAGG